MILISLVLGVVACSGNPSGGDDGGTSGPDGGGVDAPSTTPHALGTIVLGESHSGASSVTPIVTASFVPDSTAIPKTCAAQVAGCQVVTAPQCQTACDSTQACAWDGQCQATCQPVCSASCASDEECYFPSPNQPSCRKRETFEAGALAFAGTTTPITLYPPYAYSSTASGAPFLAGAQLEVQASGAAGAGFDAFDEKFTATTFLETAPQLGKTDVASVFGASTVPVGWVPGQDAITITISGLGGVATCSADDAAGHFDIPRAVLAAAMKQAAGAQSVTISITRRRDEERTGEKTHGTMTTATVQPTGWLDLVTQSSDSATFTGCPTPDTMCGSSCVDTTQDPLHCGSCTTVCGSGQTCAGGQCACSTLVIDDMEHGVSTIPASCGRAGYWFTFNDGTSKATQSPTVPSPVLIPNGGRSGSLHAAETAGSGFTTWGAGMGFKLNTPTTSSPTGTYDGSPYKGFTFWAHVGASATTAVRMNVPTSATDPSGGQCTPSTKCNDHFGTSLNLSSAWTQYTVLYSQLAQQGWGTPATFDPTKLIGVQFQTAQNVTFEVWIDDIAFVK